MIKGPLIGAFLLWSADEFTLITVASKYTPTTSLRRYYLISVIYFYQFIF